MNHSLKKYIEKCEKEKEELRISAIMEIAKKNGMSPEEWKAYRQSIDEYDWINED